MSIKFKCDRHERILPRPATATGGYVPPMADFEGAVVDRLRSDITALGLPEGLDVQCHAVHGSAGRRLLEVSKGAHMLVLGTRGGGGFRGLGFGIHRRPGGRAPGLTRSWSSRSAARTIPTTSTASCAPTSPMSLPVILLCGPEHAEGASPWRASSPATSTTTTSG